MQEERAGGGFGCGTLFALVGFGVLPVFWLAGKVLGGPPTGILAVVLFAIGLGLGYALLSAFNLYELFADTGHRICPFCRKRIPERATVCYRCGSGV